ncbi:hypothetical protein N7527_009715 [Penicillium freii]|nr:hypothetical protein N7527_009715 [Penicillium freii]
MDCHFTGISFALILFLTARTKLNCEAFRADHDLRLLVGHTNLLDSLLLDYADTKREHEQWFNNTTKASQDASDLESDFSKSEEDESERSRLCH